MESLVQQFFATSLEDDWSVEEEMLLHRRLCPYATLRPGDLAALFRLHASSACPSSCAAKHEGVVDSRCTSQTILGREEDGGCAVTRNDPGDDDDGGVRDDDDILEVKCHGAACNHVPAEYTVTGLKRYEMPVIGVYVDSRICPGFTYRVRRIDTDDFLFGNEAKTLESIGMGYGRRLTFSGDSLNYNDCYFWSDSEPNGYAFTIHAVTAGQELSVVDDQGMVIGEGVVEKVDGRPEELSTHVDAQGKVTKRVRVRLLCHLKFHHRRNNGLLELMPMDEMESVSGEALVTRKKGSRKASLVAMENVCLPRFGLCKLFPDS